MISKLKEFWCCSSNSYSDSLEDKLLCELRNSFLYIVLFSSIIYFFLFYGGESFDSIDLVVDLSVIIFFLILYLIFIKLVLRRALKKHIFSRFKKVKSDIIKLKSGNYSHRITTFGTDEFDKIIFFTNSIISKFEEKLEFEKNLSLVDPLTSCFNRRALTINFEALKERIIRDEGHLCVLSFDLDKFKSINDTYGHDIGDKVLIELANILEEEIRKYDSVYRLGGEEFLITFPNLTKSQSKELLSRIQKKITSGIKKKIKIIKQNITISGGLYCLNSNQLKMLTLSKILKACDTKLYEAKENGRNKILEVK